MSVTLQKRRPFSAYFSPGTGNSHAGPVQESVGECCALFFAKTSFTKTDRCAAAFKVLQIRASSNNSNESTN
jgi:hypothetical protein